MAEPPVLRPSVSPAAPDPASGFVLELAEGRALLTAPARALATGVELVALDVWLPDVEFPLDLARGAARFRDTESRLVRLVVDLDLEVLARRLSAALEERDASLSRLEVSVDRGLFLLEGDLEASGDRVPITATLVFTPGLDRTLRVVFADEHRYGPSNAAPERLVHCVSEGLGALLALSGVAASVTLVGLSTLTLDPMGPLLAALFQRSGFRVPSCEETSMVGAQVTARGRLRLVIGLEGSRRYEDDLRDEDRLSADRALRLLAREDAAELVAPARELVGRDPLATFQLLRSRLDASGGPRALLARLLQLGTSHPGLVAEVGDLIRDLRTEAQDDAGLLLAAAQVAERTGDEPAASQAYERAARALQREGHLRAAGHALIAAARVGLFDVERRARLADQAEALLPEHPRALAALAYALPDVDRVAQAVRAARRWAKVARSEAEAAAAHVLAAELLRDRLRDLAQAKREFERALRIDPRHARAMEGLARALVEQGDPRRASQLLEQLAARAEDEARTETAARLSLALGDVWRRIDPDAALVRYRRAAELDPRDPEPYRRVADTALGAGRFELALEALEEVRALLKKELVELEVRGVSGSVSRRAEQQLAGLHLRMGEINERFLERPAEALACFEAALALDPDAHEARQAVERLEPRASAQTQLARSGTAPVAEDTLRIDIHPGLESTRAGPTEDAEERAEALVRAGRLEEAIRVLSEEAAFTIENQERVAELSERLGRVHTAARALARAARLADEQARSDRACGLHARAASFFWEVGDDAAAIEHDRRVLDRAEPEDDSHAVVLALKRLERHARRADDAELLCQVLDRWSLLETGPLGAECLVEKADLELRRLDRAEAAVQSLERARRLTLGNADLKAAVEARLTEVLERVGDDEARARLLSERARAARDGRLKSRLLVESVRLALEREQDHETVLGMAREAVWSDPANDDARRFRTELMTAASARDPLLVAAREELARYTSREDAVVRGVALADEWVPSRRARIDLAPPEEETAMERAFELLRSLPHPEARTVTVQRRLADYARQLRLAEDELLALGVLCDLEEDPVIRLRWMLRRVQLQESAIGEGGAAQAELTTAVDGIEALDDGARARLETLLREDGLLEGEADLLHFVIDWGRDLTRENEDWRAHLDYVDRALELTEQIGRRASLHFQAGEVCEWKLGEGDEAERQYLAALALDPRHRSAKEALLSLYLSVDRFSDIAENLGVEALRGAWATLEDEPKADRVIAAAEALWPRLALGSDERGQVVLRLADLYRSDKDLPEGARLLLEEIVTHGPRSLQRPARERLKTLYLEEGDFEHYVQVLRKSAEEAGGIHERAQALAELGEALEWRLGDGAAAEREYRAALAADPSCEAARLRLGALFSAQDRFEELAAELGVETLRRELNILLGRGPRESRRALAAAHALATLIPLEQRAQHWIRVGERIGDAEGAAEAFQIARFQPGYAEAHGLFGDTARISAPASVGASTIVEPAPLEVPEAVPEEEDAPAPPASSPPVTEAEVSAEAPRPAEPEPAETPPSLESPSNPRRDSYDLLTEARLAAESAPHELESIVRLLDSLRSQAHEEMRAGPAWVHAFLEGRDPPSFPPLQGAMSATLLSAHVLAPEVKSPLGRLLSHTARAVAAILPPFSFPFAHRQLVDEERVNALGEGVAHQLEGRFILQTQKGYRGVSIEPGEPPVVLVGEDLLGEPQDGPRLRFAIARAAFLLRHGYLLLSVESMRGQAMDWVELLLRASDLKAEEKVPESLRPALGPLRTRLGPSGLAILETLSEQVGGAPTWGELERWAGALERSADRFGVMWSGDATPALQMLVEEAGLGGAELPPAALARSSSAITELLRFLVGSDFSTLLLAAKLPGGTGEA